MSLEGSASNFLDGDLWAIQTTTVYAGADSSKPLFMVTPGNKIGTIYSYVVRDGKIWWQLNSGNFVLHESGKFDQAKLQESLDAVAEKKAKEIQAKADEHPGPNLSGFFDVFGGITSFAIIAIVLIIILKYSK